MSFRPNKKKVSALTYMAQFFTGGQSFFFILLKFFYMQIRYANLYFSREGNSNSGTGSLAARRTLLPESPRLRVCVGRLAT